jgi:hypothetical protein
MDLSGADTTSADRTNSGIFIDIDSSADGDGSNEHRIYGVYSDVRHTGFSDIVRAGWFRAENNNSTEKVAQLVGAYGQAVHDSNSANGGVSTMYGVYGLADVQDDGDVDTAGGGYFYTVIGTNRDANVDSTFGVRAEIQIDKNTPITFGTMTGVSSIIDNNEGSTPVGSNTYLFKGDYQGTRFATNAYGLYVEGNKHYLEGNVGIGEESPSYKLDVSGSLNINANATNGIRFENDGSYTTLNADTVLRVNQRLEVWGGGTTGNSYLDVRNTSGVAQIKFNAHSDSYILTDVGIGTTSPDAPLRIDQDSNAVALKVTGGGGGVPIAEFIRDVVANTSVKIHGGSAHSTIQIASVNNTFSLGVNNTTFRICDDDNLGANTRLSIDSSGNVGIGTTSPGQKLQVNGSVYATLGLYSDYDYSSNRNWRIITNNFGAANWGGIAVQTSTGQDLDPNTTRFGIDYLGNVGIGTTNPQAKLHVANGTLRTWSPISGTSAIFESTATNRSFVTITGANEAELWFGNASTQALGRIRYEMAGNNMEFWTSSGQKMVINSAGSVGIGETNPSEKLHVDGKTYIESQGVNWNETNPGTGRGALHFDPVGNGANNTGNAITFGASDTNAGANAQAGIYTRSDGGYGTKMYFATTNSYSAGSRTRMMIDYNGSVGINRTDPSSSYKLDVNGTIRATGDVIAYSDIRVKENIKTIDNAVEKVKALRGVEYNKIDNPEKSIGVIAQEIEEVIPEVVKEDDQGMKSVAYGNITAVLIEAIKEQQKQIDELKSIINGSSK